MKIGGHFQDGGKRWMVYSISPLYYHAIDGERHRKRFHRDQVDRKKIAAARAVSKYGDAAAKPNHAKTAGKGVLALCMVNCGVSEDRIRKLAESNGFTVEETCRELLAAKRGD